MTFFDNFKSNLFLNLFLVYVVWGSTYLGVKVGLEDLPPLLLTALRFLIGGFSLFIFSIFTSGLPKKKEALGSATIGILLTGIGTSCVCYAIQFIPSGLVAMLVALLPIWTFALDYLFFSKKSPSKLSSSGMILGLIGVLFLFNPFGLKGEIELSQLFTIGVIFFGSVVWAYGSLLSLKTAQTPGLCGVSIQMLAGGAVALILSLILESNHFEAISGMQQRSIGALLYLILIGSYIGYTAYVWLINNAPPLLTSTYAFVNPVIAMILGYFLANEKLSSISSIASLIILVGVILMTLGRRKEKEIDNPK